MLLCCEFLCACNAIIGGGGGGGGGECMFIFHTHREMLKVTQYNSCSHISVHTYTGTSSVL